MLLLCIFGSQRTAKDCVWGGGLGMGHKFVLEKQSHVSYTQIHCVVESDFELLASQPLSP